MKKILFILSLFTVHLANGQYAPQAGILGSEAISASDTRIKYWASGCHTTRGYINIEDKSLGLVTLGDDENATGKADGSIVTLGDSGVATLSFLHPISNGDGADFAVFENGFTNPDNAEEAFLELAFVEVSSDGEHFFRFNSISNIETDLQIPGAGVYSNARLINNLAGKYIAQYGTPFDLDELKDREGLDVNRITHVRIVDVVGDVINKRSVDSKGNAINDPFPTPFPSSGFDLDAVAVLNTNAVDIPEIQNESIFSVFPNPTTDFIQFHTKLNLGAKLVFYNSVGRSVLVFDIIDEQPKISIASLSAGLYFIRYADAASNSLKYASFQKQ
jgi:hypothetical protein